MKDDEKSELIAVGKLLLISAIYLVILGGLVWLAR